MNVIEALKMGKLKARRCEHDPKEKINGWCYLCQLDDAIVEMAQKESYG